MINLNKKAKLKWLESRIDLMERELTARDSACGVVIEPPAYSRSRLLLKNHGDLKLYKATVGLLSALEGYLTLVTPLELRKWGTALWVLLQDPTVPAELQKPLKGPVPVCSFGFQVAGNLDALFAGYQKIVAGENGPSFEKAEGEGREALEKLLSGSECLENYRIFKLAPADVQRSAIFLAAVKLQHAI